jgi:hypothetical protein
VDSACPEVEAVVVQWFVPGIIGVLVGVWFDRRRLVFEVFDGGVVGFYFEAGE